MRAFIFHGWLGTPESHWKPWLGKELEKNGFEVVIPQLPNPEHPKMKEWLDEFHKLIGEPDEETFLIGHSLACGAILRYLETLEKGQKIGGAVFVAGFTDDLGYSELSDFYKTPLLWDKAKKHCDKFVAINSDNDQYVPLEHGKVFEEKLGAKFIFEKGKGHFQEEQGITELPSALKAVLDMAKF